MNITAKTKDELIKIVVKQNRIINDLSHQLNNLIDISNSNASDNELLKNNTQMSDKILNRKNFYMKIQFLLFILLIIVVLWLIFNFYK
jgi:hypothetical protein